MALSTLRFRFTLNRQTGGRASYAPGGTRGTANFSRVIVQQVAFQAGEKMFELVKTQIQTRMRADIQRELDHMAGMFMYGVVGVPGRQRAMKGNLSTIAPKAMAMEGFAFPTIAKGLGRTWDRRSPKYMAQRQSEGSGDSWFLRKGSEHIAKLKSSKTWTGAFGGVSISVDKHTSLSAKSKSAKSLSLMPTGFGGDEKVFVATVRVTAMNRITPGMLPVLGGGGLGDFGSKPRGSGLLSMLGEETANRLGGNPAPGRVPFRPTIQPFLAYFLGRQLPNAVFKRIEQGLVTKRWSRIDTSAGRTR